MQYLVDSRQAKMIDTYTIEQTGIPSLVLMERASLTVAECAERMADSLYGKKTAICSICGGGNNGGDGIAAARILFCRGYQVTIVLACQREKMSEDGRKQLAIAEKLSVPVVNEADPGAYNIIIDALFGIGLSRDIKGLYAGWINAMNHAAECGSRIVSVDIPSGISTDTGCVMGTAVRADVTVTFGYVKMGMVLYPGASYAGRILCEDIGFDKQAINIAGCRYVTYTKDDLGMLPFRRPDSNKGTFGRVLVVAGSRNMAGAACFSAEAAYRTGAGLVTVYTSESNRTVVQGRIPEAVLKTYDDDDPNLELLKEQMAISQVIVLGPGLGQSQVSEEIVRTVMEGFEGPMVVDADALNILSGHMDWLQNCQAPVAVTPHLKELSRLTGHNIQYLKENLIQICEDFRQQNGVICIAKDARTIIADGSESIFVNMSGNNGMSTGGSGDVLTGMIAGLCAQGMKPDSASRLGVYLHGLAGDLAAEKNGVHAMTASDILKAIPDLLKKIEEQQRIRKRII